MAKNATVTPWRSGTDFCWLFCVQYQFIQENKLHKNSLHKNCYKILMNTLTPSCDEKTLEVCFISLSMLEAGWLASKKKDS